MATFSTNQARQFYLAKALKSGKLVDSDALGTIGVNKNASINGIYFTQKGYGGITRSDIIKVDNIMYAKATDAKDLKHKLAKYKVTLDPTVNSGLPIVAQDYILRINFTNYFGMSDDSTYYKNGFVKCKSTMTASAFYKEMAVSLASNFIKDITKPITVYLETNGTDATVAEDTVVEVAEGTKLSTLTGTYTGIIIEEKEPEWILGTYQQEALGFSIGFGYVVSNGVEFIWGKANKVTSTKFVPNGKNTADLEYFYMGERGDIHRGVGFPHVVNTKYMVDESLEYNTLDIHFYETGSNEDVQKSEKDILIVVPKVGGTDAAGNALINSIISAVNTAAGTSIATL